MVNSYKYSILTAIIFIVISVTTLMQYFPILHNLPKPFGPNLVGTKSLHIIDNDRIEKRMPSGKRELMVNLLYPSQTNKDLETTYLYKPEKLKALAKFIAANNSKLPELIWQKLLSNIYTYTEPNAQISNNKPKYPIIIFLPGIGGENLNNSYLEQLASNGYIIVEIEPTFDVPVTIFPNGYIAQLDPDLNYAMKNNLRDKIYAYRTDAHYRWIDDIKFILQKLKELNNDPKNIFYKKLDLANIGFLGFSHGGAVVTDFCKRFDECKAGANFDGWTKTVNTFEGFNKPFLFLLSEKGVTELEELYKNMGPLAQIKEIKGATHLGFSDHILLKWPFGFKQKEANKIIKEVSDLTVNFFDKYLKQKNKN